MFIPPLFNGSNVLSSPLDKAKFAEIFPENSNLNESDNSEQVFLSITNLKLCNISLTAKLMKVIISLDFSKVYGPISSWGCEELQI